ncbi:MAG: FAD-dependent oxidoreductase [Verrucomicrobia bacterium]|nr:FAD-dependent oxidoreductase [Verrucomicrobiota bacterium]
MTEAVEEGLGRLVVIGSGLAGYGIAKELRALGNQRSMTVLTRDAGESYSKPMLSNALATNRTPDQLAQKTAAEMAESLQLTVTTHTDVRGIDRERGVVRTDDGEIDYQDLVLAVGADQISLPLSGDGVGRVCQVNDLQSYRAFHAALRPGSRVCIIGAGLIGCEFANDLSSAGHQVVVIDLAGYPLSRLVPDAVGQALQRKLSELGVVWHFDTSVVSVDQRDDGYLTCALQNGTAVEADVVLSAVGLKPRISLAEAAGLTVNRGIVVDHYLRTSDPHIYAYGDCAEFDGRVMPYILPIFTGAKVLAKTLAGDEQPVSYPVMPVAVKTPACRMIVCPPEPGAGGQWSVDGDGEDLTARFRSVDGGRLLGFALSGAAVKNRGDLVKEMSG